MKKLTDKIINDVENRVILMLAQSLKQSVEKDGVMRYGVNNADYAEAFGIIMGLCLLEYCRQGACNYPASKDNAGWWFSELKQRTFDLCQKEGYDYVVDTYAKKCKDLWK